MTFVRTPFGCRASYFKSIPYTMTYFDYSFMLSPTSASMAYVGMYVFRSIIRFFFFSMPCASLVIFAPAPSNSKLISENT